MKTFLQKIDKLFTSILFRHDDTCNTRIIDLLETMMFDA